MSALASRVPVLIDFAHALVLREPNLGVEVRSGVEPVRYDGELPWWLDAPGIGGTVVLRVNVEELNGAAQLALLFWNAEDMSDAKAVWTAPSVVPGPATYILDLEMLHRSGPEGGVKYFGMQHTLTGENAQIAYDASLVRGIRP